MAATNNSSLVLDSSAIRQQIYSRLDRINRHRKKRLLLSDVLHEANVSIDTFYGWGRKTSTGYSVAKVKSIDDVLTKYEAV